MSKEADALLIQAGELLVKVSKSIASLEARVSVLEAERAARQNFKHGDINVVTPMQPPCYMYTPGQWTVYEQYVDPTMRDTHNGNR